MRARFGNAPAIVRAREPVQLQWWLRIFACNRAEAPLSGGHGRFAYCGTMEMCP